MDHFSPLAPAGVRTLVLPVGHIEKDIFHNLLSQLQQASSIVPLKGLSSQPGDQDYLLSPLQQPKGSLFYNFTPASATEEQQQLSPFELWRETLLVIGVVRLAAKNAKETEAEIKQSLEHLRERYARVVHRHLLILQHTDDKHFEFTSQNATYVVYEHDQKVISDRLMSAVHNISEHFLRELSTYAQAMQASPSIQTPGQPAQGLLRSMLSTDDRPRSHHGTPAEPRSPSGEEGGSRPTSTDFASPPATTFDQIAVANTLGRSDSHNSQRSKSRPRKDSLDRVPVQALSKEKLKDRGKARVGVVTGSIYLLAGQWTEALKILVDNTTRLRALSDHIWHAKGLEYTFVCLLLHVWTSLDFQVPPICYQLSDKVRDRLSKAIVAELQQRGNAPLSAIEKLSASAPDLLKHILLLYHATESSLELPYLTVAEATIRFCKTLTILRNSGGAISSRDVDGLLRKTGSVPASVVAHDRSASSNDKLSKIAIANLLSHALPAQEGNIKLTEHISVLTGVASVYALLGLERKKAILLRSVVRRLVAAMEQARKLGAAEMGIHPAASLSIENGPEALLDTMNNSKGLLQLAETIVAVFGIRLLNHDEQTDRSPSTVSNFGSDVLRSDILRDLLSLCEAAPDLTGISALVSACMSNIVPAQPLDEAAKRRPVQTSSEEQTRNLSMMVRSHLVSKQLGRPGVLADFWDDNLVRSVKFEPLHTEQIMYPYASSRPATSPGKGGKSNPLLYDPNAPKEKQQDPTQILVCGEAALCTVTLQNALDTGIDIEHLELIEDQKGLVGRISGFRVGPARLQLFTFEVVPQMVGSMSVASCRVKVSGCYERSFRLEGTSSLHPEMVTIKSLGQDDFRSLPRAQVNDVAAATHITSVEVIEAQPQLELRGEVQPSSTLMLLVGEKVSISVDVRNKTETRATVLQVGCENGQPISPSEPEKSIISPQEVKRFDFKLTAQRDMSNTEVKIVYAASADSKFSRSLTAHLDITTHPGLKISWIDASLRSADVLRLAIDVFNTWHEPLQVLLEGLQSDGLQSTSGATPVPAGQVQRLFIDIKRWFRDNRVCADASKCAIELQKQVRITWHDAQRHGELYLQPSMLSGRISELIRGPPFIVSLAINADKDPSSGLAVVKAGTFFVIDALVENRSGIDGVPNHLQLSCRTKSVDPAHSRHQIAVAGTTQRLVPALRPAASITLQFALCALTLGTLDVGASLNPALPSTGVHTELHVEEKLCVMVIG